jgi:glutamine cyclotransferase
MLLNNNTLSLLRICFILSIPLISCNNVKERKVSPRIKSSIFIDSPSSFEIFKDDDTINIKISKNDNIKKKIQNSILIFGQDQDTIKFLNKIDVKTKGRFVYGQNILKFKITYSDNSTESYSRSVVIYPKEEPKELDYKIIKILPHDTKSYTQGLLIDNQTFIESSGQYDKSYIRRYSLDGRKIENEVKIESNLFAEGIAIFNNKLFMLTWKSKKALVFDKNSFELIDSFKYNSEGWGLTRIADELVMSDGSEKLNFLNPFTFEVNKSINVYDDKGKVDLLNELEYINGKIFSNIYGEDKIAIIDPLTGRVEYYINLEKIMNKRNYNNIDVMNGIAYNAKNKSIYITGKWWPSIYEIKLNGYEFE